ncbi:MAG: response regulator transcription factor [Blautia sp.]|jgi:two-component system response regulator RegX3
MELLIIEDDRTLSDGICLALGGEGNFFTQCFDLASAKEAFGKKAYDLLILDINLPDGSGYDFLREIRQAGQVPVLILTANDMEMDEVMGLELGADDYMTKPFSLAVLRARIANLLRRRQDTGAYVCGELVFHFDRMEFRKRGQELFLSKTEQKLLKLLVDHRGQILKREQLVDRLWTDGAEYVDENALSVTVSRLRSKVEDEPSKPVHIQTVYGIGYIWKEA